MVERGAHHTNSVAVAAARLAERAWTVMARGEPYVIRDVDGRPVTAAEAKAIIAERYTVSDDVRRRRRTRKRAGKASSPSARETCSEARRLGRRQTRRPPPRQQPSSTTNTVKRQTQAPTSTMTTASPHHNDRSEGNHLTM